MDMRVRMPVGHPMPEIAAFVAHMKSAFGEEQINQAIRRGEAGEPTFYAAENSHTVGTARLPTSNAWHVTDAFGTALLRRLRRKVHESGDETQTVAATKDRQGEIVRKLGLALLTATLAPAAFGAGTYSEVWNPPEARASAPHSVATAHKLAVRRHMTPHAKKVYSRHTSATTPRLDAKQGNMARTLPRGEPAMSEIPRQITPEGNVLRVTGRAASARFMR